MATPQPRSPTSSRRFAAVAAERSFMIEHWLQLGPAERLVLISYVSVMGLLAIYGLHRYWMVFAPRSCPGPPPAILGDDLPMVTVQLPVFNEKTVVNRLLDAVVALDWP